MIDLTGKVIVITGGAKGIGAASVRALCESGAQVSFSYNTSRSLASQLCDELRGQGHRVMAQCVNVRSLQDIVRFYDRTVQEYGRVDVLVNNAGLRFESSLTDTTLSDWDSVFHVNARGAFLTAKVFAPSMAVSRGGKIINVASLLGQEGAARHSAYAASKAAMIAMTKSLAKEYGSSGIAINAICPGFVMTSEYDSMKAAWARRRSLLEVDHCLRDYTNFLCFLSSDLIRGVSGRVFNADSRIGDSVE
ncbi:SDR family NAD(P)-dependent oxidoreductase [Paenarthrobacter sp. NPDC089989]|uniref:SDR family NAD(P)-dependent oxidoreductase n=1 Tax=unclassified Paenarthrobacter TaxID=2634190 RepID=UPI0038210050